MSRPHPAPDCCKVWPLIRRSFAWFPARDDPGLLRMPHIPEPGGSAMWRVYYCPACGTDVRECVVEWDRVEVEP
jgi:hypothetical protein